MLHILIGLKIVNYYVVIQEIMKFYIVNKLSFIKKKHLIFYIFINHLRFNIGNASLCRQITSTQTMRDIQWASHSCSLAFKSIGVWPENADGTDVNTVARSTDLTLMVSGDDWGKVKLYSYPVSQPKVCKNIYIYSIRHAI